MPGQGDWFGFETAGADSEAGAVGGCSGAEDPGGDGGAVGGADDESLPPFVAGGALQVIVGAGPERGGGLLDGVTVTSPGGQLPVTTCVVVGRGELGLGEMLGVRAEGSPGNIWPCERPVFWTAPPPLPESGLKWPV